MLDSMMNIRTLKKSTEPLGSLSNDLWGTASRGATTPDPFPGLLELCPSIEAHPNAYSKAGVGQSWVATKFRNEMGCKLTFEDGRQRDKMGHPRLRENQNAEDHQVIGLLSLLKIQKKRRRSI